MNCGPLLYRRRHNILRHGGRAYKAHRVHTQSSDIRRVKVLSVEVPLRLRLTETAGTQSVDKRTGDVQDKLAAVRDLRAPQNLKELWRVLGLFGYYRNFIHMYSIIAAPLIELMRGIKPDKNPDGIYTHRMGATTIQWDDQCQKAFETLKEKQTNPPVLAYPDFKSTFILYVDASHAGIACALHQAVPPSPRGTDNNDTTAPPMAAEERVGVAALQKADPTWRKIIDNIQMFDQFSIRDEVLWHNDAICLPNNKRFIALVLNNCHDANGHMGISKSYDVLRRQ
jgi:hypothetical protein